MHIQSSIHLCMGMQVFNYICNQNGSDTLFISSGLVTGDGPRDGSTFEQDVIGFFVLYWTHDPCVSS